jgi:glycosyltransferase involved in cell wall biosynthesis
LQEALRAACQAHGVLDHFRWAGWVDYADMPAYFNLAHLVVLTSDGEGLARVYLEAQATGRVLIASDIPPAQEVVEHGQTGLLFRLGDPANLAEKIILAAGDPRLRQAIGRQARARIGPHALTEVVQQYLSLFTSLARERR